MGSSVQRPLKIAIGVHGRFYAFDVAKALRKLGQDVTLFTNYPGFAARRFGIEGIPLQSFTLHGVVMRSLGRLARGKLSAIFEPQLHQWFGKWLSYRMKSNEFDVLNVYSGVAEETLLQKKSGALKTICVLERASSHIRTQSQLLLEESKRAKSHIDAPSQWMIAREEREYALADHINVPSTFSHTSFLTNKVPFEKITVTSLGVDVSAFRASEQSITTRIERIRQNKPLQVLYVGQVGFRKGLWDLSNVVQQVPTNRFTFRLVGTVLPEARSCVSEFPPSVSVMGHQPQGILPEWYAQADLFLFPTIEDGFAVVLTQAQAAGLPIIATTNCSAPDFIEEGKSGWIVPIRAPHQIVEQLLWCDTHRAELAEMVEYTHQNLYVRDWLDVGRDYLTLMQTLVAEQ